MNKAEKDKITAIAMIRLAIYLISLVLISGGASMALGNVSIGLIIAGSLIWIDLFLSSTIRLIIRELRWRDDNVHTR